jgi:hypothetical protein
MGAHARKWGWRGDLVIWPVRADHPVLVLMRGMWKADVVIGNVCESAMRGQAR